MRQKNQVELNLGTGDGWSPQCRHPRDRSTCGENRYRRPGGPCWTVDGSDCRAWNLKKALAQVKRNKGAPGVDGMRVDDLAAYLKEHWSTIREQLLESTYKPQPVRRVEIPKATGGTRPLGIPTVLDRFIQRAVMQDRWLPPRSARATRWIDIRAGLSVFRMGEDGKLDFVRKYDIDVEPFTQWWTGMIRLAWFRFDRSFADNLWSKDGMISRDAWTTASAIVRSADILKTDVAYDEIIDMTFVDSIRSSLWHTPNERQGVRAVISGWPVASFLNGGTFMRHDRRDFIRTGSALAGTTGLLTSGPGPIVSKDKAGGRPVRRSDRYADSIISERKPFVWPGNKTLAVWIAPNVEVGCGFGVQLWPQLRPPQLIDPTSSLLEIGGVTIKTLIDSTEIYNSTSTAIT